MKKFCLISVFLGLILLLDACSKVDSRREEVPEQVMQEEFTDLNAKISTLNLKYADQFCKMADTRGWFFGRWFKRIFASDAVGAAIGASCGGIGAVVGGIFGSLMATCVAYEEEDVALDCLPSGENLFEDCVAEELEEGNGVMMLSFGDEQSKDDDAEKDTALIIYDGFDRVGCLHNEIICNIYAEETDVRELNSDEILQLTINKSSGYYDDALSVAELSDIKAEVSVATNSLKDMNCENPYAVLENTMPQYANEFSIIKEYCDNVAGLCHDKALLSAYLEDFINIVQNSAVSQSSKDMLKAAACVGGNSSILWQIKDRNEGDPGESEVGETEEMGN